MKNQNDIIELIAAKELLRHWVTKYASSNKPGSWDYDKDLIQLIEDSASFLGIENPWK